MTIQIGFGIDHDANQNSGTQTFIELSNPATKDCIIDTLYIDSIIGFTNLYIGIMYNVSGLNWNTRSWANIGFLLNNLQTVSGLALQCKIGDCLALYWDESSQKMRMHKGIDGGGIIYTPGNALGDGVKTYSLWNATYHQACYATGLALPSKKLLLPNKMLTQIY